LKTREGGKEGRVGLDPAGESDDRPQAGGPGNDQLQGGGGNDILLGGVGNDRLAGQDGHDLLIGGTGVDRLDGEDGDDIFIGGTTAFDTDLDALAAILAEWTSPRSYATRVANLGGEPNPQFNQRLNQNFFLKARGPAATVFDDGAKDVLKGGAGLDWFFAKLDGGKRDVILDRT
jgi:Ca2+-binding RTX toxin-like protein